MPIKVTCQCGKSFAAKDELAGKAVKCPNCQQPLRIPGGSAAPAKPAAAKTAAKPAMAAAAAPAKPAPAPLGGSDDLFAEVGLQQQALNTRPCPGCTAPLAPDAVICIKCGYNTKLGRRMETIKVGSAAGPEGHSAMAQALLDKAAESIEEQKEEDRKKTAEGVPVYVYAIALAAVIGFCIMMSFIPQGVGMMIAAAVVIVLSFVIDFYAWLRGIIAAFVQHPALGLGIFILDIPITAGMIALVMFDVPIAALISRWAGMPILWTIFVVANWDTCGIYFYMFWFGGVLRWIGLIMLILGAMMAVGNQNDDAAAPMELPPPAVAVLDVQDIAVPAVGMTVQARKATFDGSETFDHHPVVQLPAADHRLAAGRRPDGTFHLAG
jgi:ribosomal protein L40E